MQAVIKVITTDSFQNVLKILGVVFIILTYFISIAPDAFVKLGYFGIFLFNVVSSGLLIIPVLVEKLNIWGVVFFSALGNIINTSIYYFVGATSSSLFSQNRIVATLKKFMKKWGYVAVYIFAVIPFPLDINALLAGYIGLNFKYYLLINFLGKITVFSLVGLGYLSVISFWK